MPFGLLLVDDFEVLHKSGAQVPRALITVNGFKNSHITCIFLIEPKSLSVDKEIGVVNYEIFGVNGHFESLINFVYI